LSAAPSGTHRYTFDGDLERRTGAAAQTQALAHLQIQQKARVATHQPDLGLHDAAAPMAWDEKNKFGTLASFIRIRGGRGREIGHHIIRARLSAYHFFFLLPCE
jgi:hypothetical protein